MSAAGARAPSIDRYRPLTRSRDCGQRHVESRGSKIVDVVLCRSARRDRRRSDADTGRRQRRRPHRHLQVIHSRI